MTGPQLNNAIWPHERLCRGSFIESRGETVRKAYDAFTAWPCGSSQRHLSIQSALRIPATSTLAVVLEPFSDGFGGCILLCSSSENMRRPTALSNISSVLAAAVRFQDTLPSSARWARISRNLGVAWQVSKVPRGRCAAIVNRALSEGDKVAQTKERETRERHRSVARGGPAPSLGDRAAHGQRLAHTPDGGRREPCLLSGRRRAGQ